MQYAAQNPILLIEALTLPCFDIGARRVKRIKTWSSYSVSYTGGLIFRHRVWGMLYYIHNTELIF